jgi:hypothetical protein
MKNIFLPTIGLLLLWVALGTNASDLSLKLAEKEPPKDLGASIIAKLQPKAIQLFDGDKPAYEFWFAAELPLQSKPASAGKALDAIKQATLLGAVAVSKPQRDYRDDEIAAGVYTMRFALQPQDGNHLGTAEFSYFAVLIPAKLDPAPDAIADYKKMVKTSSKQTASDHPVILSLRPAANQNGDVPKLNEPAPEHKSVRVKVPGKVMGTGESETLVMEVVYQGTGHK